MPRAAEISLDFRGKLRDESCCAASAEKDTRNDMTNPETATVAKHGAHGAPVKASSNKQTTAGKGAPKAHQLAKRVKAKNDARQSAKTPKLQPGPRPASKGAKLLALLARPNGASLTELMKATKWQAHSIRGFLSTASRKRRVAIQSFKNDQGERIYRIQK